MNDLSAEGQPLPGLLEARLQAWADRSPPPMAAVYAGDYDDEISDELAETLRGFGYLQ